jgi:PEGA domain-containing protein
LAEARRSAAELKTKLGQIEVACATDGAEVSVDGKPVGSTPLGQMVWTTPGRHQVAVQQPGFSPAIEEVGVAAGNVSAISVDLRPIDLRAANPGADGALLGGAGADQQPIYRRVWFWVAVSAVVATGATIAVILATRGTANNLPDTTLGAQRTF